MSVFREKARKQLEEFARAAKQPSISGASAFNWYIQPQPDQLLRVAVAVAFRRAVLKHVYSILRGKDLETGQHSSQRRDEQFDRLQLAQDHVVNLLHWHEFLQCLERGGFRGSKMISGENAILYSYALWLIGRVDYQVPLNQLKEIIARWFFMAHTTAGPGVRKAINMRCLTRSSLQAGDGDPAPFGGADAGRAGGGSGG